MRDIKSRTKFYCEIVFQGAAGRGGGSGGQRYVIRGGGSAKCYALLRGGGGQKSPKKRYVIYG